MTKQKMTVGEFLIWVEQQPASPRYELIDGIPVAMGPQQVRHARIKKQAVNTLDRAIVRAGLDCEALPDGMAIKIDDHCTYEPDAQVYCGKRMEGDDVLVPNPVIVVEVLSPGTKHIDASDKLSGYFAVESIRHYLMVDPLKRLITHHARDDDGIITMTIIKQGEIYLTPPGLEIHIDEFFD